METSSLNQTGQLLMQLRFQLLNTISPPFHALKFNYYKFIPFLLYQRTQPYCSQNEHKKSPLMQAALSTRTTSTTVHPNIKAPRIYVRIPLPPLLLGRISSISAKSPPPLQYYYHHYPHCCHRCQCSHHHHLTVYTAVKGVIILSLPY